jgi:hypothetical protein
VHETRIGPHAPSFGTGEPTRKHWRSVPKGET